MNKRQKKKLFKRIHGYNPPKKMKLAAVSESDTIVFEMSEIEYEEQIEKVRMMFRNMGTVIEKAVEDIGGRLKSIGEDIGDRLKNIGEALQTGYELEELPIVQTTQILTERRGKRGWTRKRR